ncbi:hypothetical protein FRC06_010440 [Ceratobasidium sp. 370]|nr:hypothetical protein FRC06_010440 [Ceratobasidium sp. 370]
MQIVSKVFNIPSLTRPPVKYRYIAGVEMSSRETLYPAFPQIVLGTPVSNQVRVDTPLKNQLNKYFAVAHNEFAGRDIPDRIDTKSLVRYGRLRIVAGGDRIRTASAVEANADPRDNSYIKYDLLPDRNAAYQNRADVPYRQALYGRLLDIFYVEFIDGNVRRPYLLARVKECKTNGRDAALPENPLVSYTQLSTPDIIHANTIIGVVGRVKLGNAWAIVDRGRHSARTQFVDDEGNEEYD